MSKKQKAKVYHFDLFGKRQDKYEYLNKEKLHSIEWNDLDTKAPRFYFVYKNLDLSNKYDSYINTQVLFKQYSSGIQTEFDHFSIQDDFKEANDKLDHLRNSDSQDIIKLFGLQQHHLSKVEKSIADIKSNKAIISKILYRPFDTKYCIYTGNSNGIMGRPRYGIMQHLLKTNYSIALTKTNRNISNGYYFCFNSIAERHLLDTAGDSIGIFPLYLYPEENKQESIGGETGRKPNLNMDIVKQIADKIGLKFTAEKEETEGTFAPIDILDYIYAVLHSPAYREKYKEFLKIDFPRVPYPKDTETFWALAALGRQIREIHLLESPVVEEYITQYPIDGDNTVAKPTYKKGKVYINDTLYFDNVPQVAWEFYIGGYQPAQKWLKDRKGRTLDFEDILHYQKMIVALTETDRLMKEVDKIGVE